MSRSGLGSAKRRHWPGQALAQVLAALLLASISQAGLQLGSMTFDWAPAKKLDNPVHLSEGLSSMSFVGSVGGVAFGGTAAAASAFKVAALAYDSSQPDCKRLRVTLADAAGASNVVSAPVCDWELVPIAKFAAGEQDSCFTLFGELTDSQETQRRRALGHKIMNYHPAFADTLLGLRLGHGDILILYPNSCDLPKQDGTYLLGQGESAPNVEANTRALMIVREKIESLPGGPFRSYVICDEGVTVTYAEDGGRLVLSGEPVWQCWKNRTEDEAEIQALEARANAEGNRVLNEEFRRDAAVLSRAALEQKYEENYQRTRHAEIFDKVVSEALLLRMPDYSRELSRAIKTEGGVNPAVYDALVTTMRYAAFFRAAKKANAANYADFLGSLATVEIRPAVRTPTVLVE